jgi:predicted RNA-binding protein with PUA-like domain
MKLLVDTNIIIYREDDRILAGNVQNLFSLLNRVSAELYVHPASVNDILRDADEQRRDVILSKLRTYRPLPNPPVAARDAAFVALVGEPRRPQDQVDNEILFAVRQGAVDFLITEDAGIHRKASITGETDRVLHVDDALHYFTRFLPQRERHIAPPSLRTEYLFNLNRNDPFFDSLKKDYPRFGDSPSFEEWFDRKARNHDKCLVSYQPSGGIGAILITKIEDEEIEATPPLPRKNRLKIATLKVADYGLKIGELLLKLSFDTAMQRDVTEVYLTHFTEEGDRLVELIQEYGFEKVAVNSRGEDVFVKKMVVEDRSLIESSSRTIYQKYYPLIYDGPQVKKWIIPILPEYHEKLFTDFGARQTTLAEHGGGFIVEGNAIKKAYLCNSPARTMAEGDIVLFYRSHDASAVTSMGVIEEVYLDVTDNAKIARLVGKRTVYSPEEIERIPKPLTIIMFRHITHLSNPITLKQLKQEGIRRGPPISANVLSDEEYRIIKAQGGINGRYTVN